MAVSTIKELFMYCFAQEYNFENVESRGNACFGLSSVSMLVKNSSLHALF